MTDLRRLVGNLHGPTESAEQVLQEVTLSRAGGRENSLEEFTVANALSNGVKVSAEEIIVKVADGRSVRTLVNATPVNSSDGELQSVVVTVQDMTTVEELERLRVEFLAMVANELRSPLAAIRGSATDVLTDESAMDPVETREFLRIIVEECDQVRGLIGGLIDVAPIRTGLFQWKPNLLMLALSSMRQRTGRLTAAYRTLHVSISSRICPSS